MPALEVFAHGPEDADKRVVLNLETGEGVVLEPEAGLFQMTRLGSPLRLVGSANSLNYGGAVCCALCHKNCKMRNWPSLDRKEISFWQSIVSLIGHIAGTAVLFVCITIVAWLLGWGVHYMNGVHPFSPTVLVILGGVEHALLVVDIGLSGFILFVGAWRFVKEIWNGQRHAY